MNDTEYYSYEDRLYENPTISRDEQMSFADNLRAAQQATNAEIKTQTENLGTQIPSVKGGLTGPEGYFQSRYQTPRTNAIIGDLRAAAQADALNKVLSDYSSQMQKKYKDAYKQYQKNQARRSRSGSGYGGYGGYSGYGGSDDTAGNIYGGVDVSPSEESTVNEWLGVDVEAEHAQYPDAGTISTIAPGNYIIENGKKIPMTYKYAEDGTLLETNDPSVGVTNPANYNRTEVVDSAIGAAIGSVIPGIGPIIGAALGSAFR